MLKIYSYLLVLFFSIQGLGSTPLSFVQLDTPRETMSSFMSAMQDYKKGEDSDNDQLKDRLNDAVRCLNLSKVNSIVQKDVGKKAAILLKEVIDRVIIIDYSKIPDNNDKKYWPIKKDTEIIINQTKNEERHGAYLFSPDTVDRAQEFYNRVKHLPYLKGSGQGANYAPPITDKYIPAWAKQKSLGIPNWKWMAIFIALLLGFLMKAITQGILHIVKKVSKVPENSFRYKALTLLAKPTGLLIAATFWYTSLYFLNFQGNHGIVLKFVSNVTISLSVIWLSYNLVDLLGVYLVRITQKTDNNMDDQLVPMVNKALRAFVLIFGVLLTFQNLGFNVMSLMAGLGLGGLAFALAAKDTAANVFGSITIILDRPFKLGDWVKAGGTEGTVEEIGFRSTRIRTFYNSLITVPNSQLANYNIDNMGMREFRRVNFNLGVAYDTPPEKLEAFLEGIKNIIKNNEFSRKDYMQVWFRSYGDHSLNIMVYYFLKVKSWDNELLQTQNINLEILRLAEKLKVEFAFPTQTLHVNNVPPSAHSEQINREEMKKIAEGFANDGYEAKPEGLGLYTPPFKDK